MVIQFVISIIASFAITAVAGLFILPVLRRLKASQTERDDGPESHLKKTGTPTMGGVIFLTGFTVISIIFAIKHSLIIPIIISTLAFGIVGFADDYIKVVKKRSLGLTPLQKMALQIIAALMLICYMAFCTEVTFDMALPFSALFSPDGQNIYVNLGLLTIPFLFVVILGTVNGSNFTDGIDGLLSSVSIVIAVFVSAVAFKVGSGIAPAAGAMIGALFGFLLYNRYPARVFMGDTGSLAIGGFVAASLLCLKLSIVTVLVAFVYLAEVLSVIIQVSYFKATHGKRIFKMAPIHHHFELSGWSEVKVVRNFTLLTFVLCLITFFVI